MIPVVVRYVAVVLPDRQSETDQVTVVKSEEMNNSVCLYCGELSFLTERNLVRLSLKVLNVVTTENYGRS